jgi:molybdate transport system substrate-binding protein
MGTVIVLGKMRIFLSLSIWLVSLTPALHAEETTIAVAANFNFAMEELVTAFEAESGHTVNVAYGSSGRLYAQIVNGAPYQLFFSADQEKPEALVKEGLAEESNRFTYATGTLLLWWLESDKDIKEALDNRSLERIAIANPRLAPYGQAAMQVLESLGLDEPYESRLVMGENVSQVYQFVATGNVDAGFIALSQIIQFDKPLLGTGWIVPEPLHDPIYQDVVLLNNAENNLAAKAFLEFMRGEQAKTIIDRFGYKTE